MPKKFSVNKFNDYLQEEEEFLKDSKKFKKERKLKSSKDRSKYKKTDLKKQKSLKTPTKFLNKAIVLSILGEEILVNFNKKKYICTLRGVLKKEKSKDKNIISVGDIVDISFKNNFEATIENIHKRYSILSRSDKTLKKRKIIAVNIDQVLITTSLVKPSFKPFLIDRYIITSQKENMVPIIIINKIDLLKKNTPEEEIFKNFIKIYKELGFVILSISCKEGIGLKKLLNAMKGKKSVFSGQSGTGKSSIINAILHTKFKTAKVSKKSYKGTHITTKSQLVEIKEGGFCIDTPGIKSFGIWDLKIEDVKNYFFELKKFAKNCKYSNCLHLQEKNCSVQKAFKENKISSLRFESYRSLIKEIIEKKGNLL